MTEFIWLDGKSNVELGFYVQGTSKRPGLPSTVDRTLVVPGRNGLWDYGADLSSRSFEYECAFIERDSFALQQRVQALATLLLDSYGKPRTIELRMRERPGQYFTVRYVGSFDIERIIGLGTFTLPLTAFDPFARDAEKIEEQTITTVPTQISVQSLGNVRTEPIITITNTGTTTLTSFTITNEYEKGS
ncbi:phage tail domain-containing protein [Paenibacillus cineris]|uniref:phage tail domain-containing protein n=1 Tax=Paenibacillus cineris TaxID=237530 RepID=UPI001B01123D|nr:phage tail domain-containing protein [Paenibacillus cineris]GIO63583.1 hypothetical protein J43TS9_51570 [Paenibacillus cineris]